MNKERVGEIHAEFCGRRASEVPELPCFCDVPLGERGVCEVCKAAFAEGVKAGQDESARRVRLHIKVALDLAAGAPRLKSVYSDRVVGLKAALRAVEEGAF